MKRILLATDVFGWGGHERAEMIKKHLSDTYSFDIVDSDGLKEHVDKKLFGKSDIKKFFKRKNFSMLIKDFEKKTGINITNAEDIDDFVFKRNKRKRDRHEGNTDEYDINDMRDYMGKWSKRRRRASVFPLFETYMNTVRSGMKFYDLYYLMFHSMLKKQDVQKLMDEKQSIVTVVTGYPTLRKGMFGGQKHFNGLSRKCKAIFANNIMSLQDLRKVYNGNVYYVPRGVDTNIFHPKRFAKEPFTVGYVGKPVDEKGLETIIRPACKKAKVRLITNTRNYTNAWDKDRMNNFYNDMSVYVVASTIDGTPNPALEAAACGRPIISNKIGNMPQFIQEGYNGFLVERNIKAYVDKIEFLKNNFEKTKRMGEHAREKILAGWTWKHIAKYERKALEGVFGE